MHDFVATLAEKKYNGITKYKGEIIEFINQSEYGVASA